MLRAIQFTHSEMPIGRGDDKNRAASRVSGLEFSFVGDVRDIVQEALDAPVPSEAK